jgi:hypothetical protein
MQPLSTQSQILQISQNRLLDREGLALVEREKRPAKLDGQVSIKPSPALFFKYQHEFTSYSHTPGNTLVFSVPGRLAYLNPPALENERNVSYAQRNA